MVTWIFKALVHFVQLHHVQGRPCERLRTTIKRHIECRIARLCNNSQSRRSWYGHALNAPLGSFNLRFLVRWRALQLLAFMVRVVLPEWSSIKRDQSLHFKSFFDSLFRPSAFPCLLDRVPKLSLSERSSDAVLEELDEPRGGELFHRFDFSTLDAKRTFKHTKVVQIFALQDMRAMGRQNDHENPHCCTNLKHLVDCVSITSVTNHHGRILRRQIGNTRREMILQPSRECESVE
mmetsp:Transcript_18/g.75  ORF Transcript_18/g.75 Transcript_18/m.75 type:complete len:235 (+) Transcript_18:907-1611(+)